MWARRDLNPQPLRDTVLNRTSIPIPPRAQWVYGNILIMERQFSPWLKWYTLQVKDINKDELKKKLTAEEYHVTQEKGTEVPFSGKYYKEKAKGLYNCKVCGTQLFSSDAKYDSDAPGLAGWPSFDQAIPGAVEYTDDMSDGMHRVEVVCAKCKAHLGHIFDDTDAPTGKHFCINSCALDLKKEE